MFADYCWASNRNYYAVSKQQALPTEVAQEPFPEFHRVQTLVGPQLRTDCATVRDIVTMTRGKDCPNNINFLGALAEPGAGALRGNVHLLKLSEDADAIDSKYFDWKVRFGDLVLRNIGVKDLLGRRDPSLYYAELPDSMKYAVMAMDKITVTLLGSYTNHSEVYTPKSRTMVHVLGQPR